MGYKYSKGTQVIGDLQAADDTQRDTKIDFGEDYIGLETSGSVRMVISGSDGKVGIGTSTPDYTLDVAGDISVDQKIIHNGDADTLIRFDDDQIILKAGNISMVKMEKNSSAPHEVTINDGSNNIDFVVKGNGSNAGNPGMKFDASTNKLGINGVGTPTYELDVAGNIGLNEYIYHNGDDDTYIRFQDNDVRISAGGGEKVTVNSNGVVFNSKATDLNGNQIVGGVYEIDQGIFQNPHSSYNPIYFPSDDSFTERVGPSAVNYFIAPFNGEIVKIQIKTTTDFSSKALTASLHVGTGTNNAYSATPQASVALNGLAANTVHNFDFGTVANRTFNVGDVFGFSLELEGGYAGDESIHFTTVVKYNPYV